MRAGVFLHRQRDAAWKTRIDQLVLGDRRSDQRGKNPAPPRVRIGRDPRLGRGCEVQTIEDGARAEQVFDRRPQTAAGPAKSPGQGSIRFVPAFGTVPIRASDTLFYTSLQNFTSLGS
jgi:hypothetical protein